MSNVSGPVPRRAHRRAVEPSMEDTVDHATLAGAVAAKVAEAEAAEKAAAPGSGNTGNKPAAWPVRAAELILALALAFAGWMGVSLLPSSTPHPTPPLAVTQTGLYCPGAGTLAGTVTAFAKGDATWQPVTGAVMSVSGSLLQQSVTGESALTGSGTMAALAQFTRAGQAAAAACAGAMASGYLLVGAPNATLVLTNVDPTDAVLNVTLLGTTGQIDSKGLIDYKVPGHSTSEIALGDYASGMAPLAVQWQNTIGRVVAWVRIDTPDAFELVAPTRTGGEVVVPGIPSDGAVKLLIANPSAKRIVAKVDALTTEGRVPVAGAEQVTVESGSLTSVDLAGALQGETVSLVVTADEPVAATAWVQVGSDFAAAPGIASAQIVEQDRFTVLAGPCRLVLSDTTAKAADITVTVTPASGAPDIQQVSLNAGATTTVELGATGSVLVHGPTSVVAALISQPGNNSANGTSIIPLPADTAWTGITPIWVEGQAI